MLAIMTDMENVRELYSRQDIRRLKNEYRNWKIATALIAAVTLAVCVLLCCLTDMKNAAVMERAAVAVSVLGGWIVIYLYHNVVQDRRAGIGHAEMLLEGERETVEGVLSLSGQRMRIRGSIRFYPLTLTDGGETHKSKVIDARAAALRNMDGRRLRLYTVNGYAAAYEEL